MLRLPCVACSRISSVQLFHLMPKDWADQKRNQLRIILQELTQGGHFFVVYYSPISEHYQAITSQSWSRVVQSKELSRVLHSATQPIAYDEQDLQWCQKECSSLDMVLKKHISRDDAKCLASNHHPSIETRRHIKLTRLSRLCRVGVTRDLLTHILRSQSRSKSLKSARCLSRVRDAFTCAGRTCPTRAAPSITPKDQL